MREGSKQIGKRISRRKKQRKFSVMELIDGCTRVHVDNAENENGLEHRKICIMIEVLYNLHRIDKTFSW